MPSTRDLANETPHRMDYCQTTGRIDTHLLHCYIRVVKVLDAIATSHGKYKMKLKLSFSLREVLTMYLL